VLISANGFAIVLMTPSIGLLMALHQAAIKEGGSRQGEELKQ